MTLQIDPVRKAEFIGYLAVAIVAMTFAIDGFVLITMLGRGVPEKVDNVLLGTILTAWHSASLGIIVGFFYGRSSDSDRKTEIIANATPSPQPNSGDGHDAPG
jgi:hypothetical protein